MGIPLSATHFRLDTIVGINREESYIKFKKRKLNIDFATNIVIIYVFQADLKKIIEY